MHSTERCRPTSPLRVLQIASTSKIGGAETMILHLMRHADPQRLEIELLTLMGPGDLTRRADSLGIRAVNWGLDSLADPRLLRRMRNFLIEGGFHLIHGYGLRADLLTRWVAHGLRIPYISSISSIDPWRKPLHVWLDRLTADGVNAWIAVAEAARQSRIKREKFPPDRIHTVLNGIPDCPPPNAADRIAARKSLALAEDVPVLLMVANVRPAKGYADLIEAMAAVRVEMPDVICLCAGMDETRGVIPALAKARGLETNMRWFGFVNDTLPLLAAADVAVLSSHWEGCPVNLIEAMRAGRASIATRVGGIPEMIADGIEGRLVEPKRPDQLAQAMLALLRDAPMRHAMGQAARKAYEARFTVETMVEQLTALYECHAAPRD